MESKSRQVKLAGLPIGSAEARRPLAGTLRGHALNPSWLPAVGVLARYFAVLR